MDVSITSGYVGAGGRSGMFWSEIFKRVLRSLCVVWRFLGSLLLGEAGPPSLLPPCRQSLFAGAFFVVLFLSEAWTVVQSLFSVRALKIVLLSQNK